MEHGLYIHIPFCVKKCAYCDFASYPAGKEVMRAYTDSLCQEILQRRNLSEGICFDTVFFGGGTPSRLPLSLMERIVCTLRGTYAIAPDAEWTLEANPGTVTPQSLAAYHAMGFGRISLGFQASQPRLLAMLGRIHTTQDFLDAVAWAKEAGFSSINADVMAALPGQRTEDLTETLDTAIRAGIQHVSLYGLQVEEGTLLAEMVERGEWQLPTEDETADMLQTAQVFLENHGYSRYEVSNFSLPGYRCRHNLLYWHYDAWLGLGCAAASQWKDERWTNPAGLDAYHQWVCNGALPFKEALSSEDRAFEAIMMGLRLVEGLDRAEYCLRFGLDLVDAYPDLWQDLQKKQLVAWNESHLYLTPRGMDVMNGILVQVMETMSGIPSGRI